MTAREGGYPFADPAVCRTQASTSPLIENNVLFKAGLGMSRKSVLLSRLGCGFVFILGTTFALDASAALSVSPSSVTGIIHYDPAQPTLSVTGPTAGTVNTAQQILVGTLSTAGNVSINGVNVPLDPSH